MADGSAPRVKAGDAVRVHYHPPGQVVSFVEGVVSRVNVTSTRGPGFLIDITRDVFLGREQPVGPGYEHYVLYERLEDVSGQVEVLSQAQGGPTSHSEHASEPDVEQQPEAERKIPSEPEPKSLIEAEPDAEEPTPELEVEADRSQVQVEHQDRHRRASRIMSIFRRQR
jgi:hypothetical protein